MTELQNVMLILFVALLIVARIICGMDGGGDPDG